MPYWQWSLGIASLAGLLLLAAGYIYEKLGERKDKKTNLAPGRMVSVGDHKLHLLCKGRTAPAVVIEQGAGEPSRLWGHVQDKIAEFACVCTYDRAGYGWSEPVEAGRTVTDRAEELHTLLTNSGIPGPYVLVAHSYGGLIVRCFARNHPNQIAGVVLVDTPDDATIFRRDVLNLYARIRLMTKVVQLGASFGALRLLSRWFRLDHAGFSFVRPGEYAAAGDDLASLQRAEFLRKNSEGQENLGDLPLAVIAHGQPFPGPFSILENSWSEGQERLARLSTNSLLIVAKNSNHMIQIDEPGLVVDAIRSVHGAARNQTRLAFVGDSQKVPAHCP